MARSGGPRMPGAFLLSALVAAVTLWFLLRTRSPTSSGRAPSLSKPNKESACEAAYSDKVSAACVRDRFRYGEWLARDHHKRMTCDTFEYVNKTCGPEFCANIFTRSIHDQVVLFVGDSTMHGMYNTLVEAIGKHRGCLAKEEFREYSRSGCPRENKVNVNTSIQCGRHRARLLYNRHDHGAGQQYGRDPGSRCEAWHGPVLSETAVVVLTFGSHLNEHKNESVSVEHWQSHTKKITALVKHRAVKVVYVVPQWGVLYPSLKAQQPLKKPPATIDTKFGWNEIPRVTSTIANTFEAELTSQVRVIDASYALSMRPDCRHDHLHMERGALVHSVLRLLQNVIIKGGFG